MANETLNAFRPLVGLRGVDDTASSWVNDLAGLSTELVGDLALPSDLLGGVSYPEAAVWEGVHRNACERLQNEVLLQLSENYDFQPVIMRTLEPSRKRPFVTSPMQDGVFLATLVTIPHTPNATINLRSLTVSVPVLPGNQQVTASVRVYDLDAQSQLYAAPHAFDAGINTIELNESYRTVLMEPLQLVVMVDASQLSLHALNVCWNDCDNDGVLIEGKRTINPANLADTLLDEEIYIALDIEVTRSLDKLLPRYAKDMQTAYAYLCGSLLMTEKLGTPNLSVFTLSNAVFTERMESQLSNEFKRALRPIVRRISNDLLRKEALTVPTATPSEVTYISGSYV
ncbi:hypothetical protein [Spirosoma aerolatum]|uniref:hypothetical protein n=1 Tax=Spirosoma aerolatum TaxID=1211326 RepID=UPI0009ACDE71|nr:hypothetical protein [Spirosoma aerolatum]